MDERDARMANDLRQVYPPLSEESRMQMNELKDIGQDFINAVRRLSPPGRSSREQALAITKMEEAVFWAVKYATGDRQ